MSLIILLRWSENTNGRFFFQIWQDSDVSLEITCFAETPVKMTTMNFSEPSSDLLGLSQTYFFLWYFSMIQPAFQKARCHFTNTLTLAGSFCPFHCIAVFLHQILLETVSSSICFHRPVFNLYQSLWKSETHSRDHPKFLLRYKYIFFPLLCFQFHPVEEWWWR